jgi:predicted nucleic acid-binding protein
VNQAALERAIPEGISLLLDTTSLFAYFGEEPTSEAAQMVVDEFVRSGRNRGLIAAVTIAELSVRSLRAGRPEITDAVARFLRLFPNLDIVPVDFSIALVAAHLRARDGMDLPDALIAACGLDRTAGMAISDDRGWPQTLSFKDVTMRVVPLRSFATPA